MTTNTFNTPAPIVQRTLNQINTPISAIGLGCMGMSEFYGDSDDTQSLALLDKAIEIGINFFDTADTFGLGHNEMLLGQCLAKHRPQRDKLVIATKFGIVREQGKYERRLDNSPAYIETACNASLKRLGVECIDLYYCHRRDHDTPLEVMMDALAKLVKQGKIKGIGLSEVSSDTLRQAHAIHPITAVQSEYSLWSRTPETDILPTCRELGVNFVAYSPLGRAFLTGKLDTNNLPDNDFRQHLPRLQGEQLNQNQQLISKFSQLASQWGHSNAQLCLAWMLNKYPHVIPIAGTRQQKYLLENANATGITLSAKQIEQLDDLFNPEKVAGQRYPDAGWAGIEK